MGFTGGVAEARAVDGDDGGRLVIRVSVWDLGRRRRRKWTVVKERRRWRSEVGSGKATRSGSLEK